MRIIRQISLMFVFCTGLLHVVQSQELNNNPQLFIFPDREFCVSGDTIRFDVAVNFNEQGRGNVVHVQLTDIDNRLISSVMMKSTDKWADGFIQVPDSLTTGVYFLSAFFYGQSTLTGHVIHQKSLFVYNRFQKDVETVAVPVQRIEGHRATEPLVKIIPERKIYSPRSKVAADIDFSELDSGDIQHVVVKAFLTDSLAQIYGGNFWGRTMPAYPSVPVFDEKDGFVISGKVVIKDKEEPPGKALVFLSLVNDSLYLDYCVPDSNGYFDFFIKNAQGSGEIILHAMSEKQEEMVIRLEQSPLIVEDLYEKQAVLFDFRQTKFIEKTVDGAWLAKIFAPAHFSLPPRFSMPPRYSLPFYGEPYKVVDPDEYYDLDDFQQIARELLPGVRYRARNNDITLRLLHFQEGVYFEDEPFRLINGVPVFNNRLLSSLGTADIDYIEYVTEDRLFGDIRFRGILAVYLKEPYYILTMQPNVLSSGLYMLQPERSFKYNNPEIQVKNSPDFRTIYFRQRVKTGSNHRIEFYLSDVKGKVEISVEGITSDGKIFKVSETVEVK
jgi:hypothetical protein